MGKRSSFVSAWTSAAVTAALAFGFGGTGPAQATVNLVQNGDFTLTPLSSPGGYLCQTGVSTNCTTEKTNVTDWLSTCTSDCGVSSTAASLLFNGTNGGAFNGNRGLWAFTGLAGYTGNYVAIDGDPKYSSAIYQTIDGLTVGTRYNVTFEQAAAQQNTLNGATTEWWGVSLGGVTQNSTTMDNPSHSFVGWYAQTLQFTATATSEVLNFQGHGTPGGEPPIALLADVSVLAAPEPSTWAMMALGFVGLGLAGSRRFRKRVVPFAA